jgi:hypothetical protein
MYFNEILELFEEYNPGGKFALKYGKVDIIFRELKN